MPQTKKINIVESPIGKFISGSKLRGIRRYIPKNVEILTLGIPPEREVETADDIKWIVLQAL